MNVLLVSTVLELTFPFNLKSNSMHFRKKELELGVSYVYRVQTGSTVSKEFTFRAMKEGSGWPTTFLVYGDMGVHGGAPILPYLKKETAKGNIDAVIHAGDFAYDLMSEGGYVRTPSLR